MKIEINGAKAIITLVVLVALFLLLWRGCGGKDTSVAATNAKIDSAVKAFAMSHAEANRLQDTLNALRRDSMQQRINTEALAEEANKALAAQAHAADETKSYQKKYADARTQVNDLLALATCDSLTRAITKERFKAAATQNSCNKQVIYLGGQLANRNQQISTLNQQVKVLQQPANIVNDALHAVKAATKEAWIKGYVGASVMGNQTNFGFGSDLTLLFKGGVMVRGGAVLMGSQVMGVMGVSKLLSFKKH